MKILIVADEEDKGLWDFYTPDKLADIDLILSCGDLRSEYLSFLVTMAHAPLLYVHGNHDTHYDICAPEGCQCIDDCVFEYQGIRILGLGGSLNYNNGKWQYNQDEMHRRVKKLRRRRKLKDGIDILLTHAPAHGIGDGKDPAHVGFTAFVDILQKYRPKYHVHGHVHLNYGPRFKRATRWEDTLVINGYRSCILDYK